MAKLKKYLLFALGGAVLGWIVSIFIAPAFQGWFLTPGSDLAALCPCKDVINATTSGIIRIQLVCMAIGIVGFVVLGVFILRGKKDQAQPASPTPPASPAT